MKCRIKLIIILRQGVNVRVLIRVKIIPMSKLKPGTVEKTDFTQSQWRSQPDNLVMLCKYFHRDYKRIEWASREKSRDKLNKSNEDSGI